MKKPVSRFKFTNAKIKALKLPDKGRIQHYDTEIPKLMIRVTAAGSKTFYVYKWVGSEMVWVSLDTLPNMTVEQARSEAQIELGEFAKGNNPAEAKRIVKATPTLGETFGRYSKHSEAHGVKGIAEMRAMYERCLGELPDTPVKPHGRKRSKHPAGVNWHNRKLNTIDQDDVYALHSGIGATHRTLADRVIEMGSAVYNCAAANFKYKGENPFKGVKRFGTAKRDRFVQPSEFPAFMEALAADNNESFKAFVAIQILVGLRLDNGLGLRWDQISFERRVVRIPDETSKNSEAMVIPLSAEAIEILLARKKVTGNSPFVFPAVSKSGYMTSPKKRWAQLLKRAGLDDLHIHDLRRTMGSYQAIAGASLLVIGKSLGHKSARATEIYSRLHIDPIRESMEKATAMMMKAGGLDKNECLVCH